MCKDVKMFILQTYANEEKRSQDMYWKWITGYFGTGHTGHCLKQAVIKLMSYSVIEVVKYTCDNLMVSFCKVFGYRWQFVTETTSIF